MLAMAIELLVSLQNHGDPTDQFFGSARTGNHCDGLTSNKVENDNKIVGSIT